MAKKIGQYPEILSDLSLQWGEILEKAGVVPEKAAELSYQLCEHLRKHWGGQAVYISKGASFTVDERNSRIFFNEFKGNNHEEIARKHGLTVTRVYQIVNEVARAEAARRQPILDGFDN